MNANLRHTGKCHCEKVRFEVLAPAEIIVQRCNCSMCRMSGFEHLIVPQRDFSLLSSWEQLNEYRFNTRVARHLFCRNCGIKPFYVPRSNPNGYSINFRCLDQSRFKKVQFENFDGQNWEENAASLTHFSE